MKSLRNNISENKTIHFGKEDPNKKPPYEETTTHSLYIPMRDGIKLAIDIILPNAMLPEEQLPILLYQTRYSPQT